MYVCMSGLWTVCVVFLLPMCSVPSFSLVLIVLIWFSCVSSYYPSLSCVLKVLSSLDSLSGIIHLCATCVPACPVLPWIGRLKTMYLWMFLYHLVSWLPAPENRDNIYIYIIFYIYIYIYIYIYNILYIYIYIYIYILKHFIIYIIFI